MAVPRLDVPPTLEELYKLKDAAPTYEAWQAVARQIDDMEHLDVWRHEDASELYDYHKLRRNLTELRQVRVEDNIAKLLYIVRTTFSRNIANMGDPQLYSVAHCGTKTLIEEYISECEDALKYLASCDFLPPEDADSPDTGASKTVPTPEAILNTLVQTRKAFGRTALVLSGGSTLGFLHVGVMRELIDQNLLPRIISGSSAGSIFASILCIHRDEEFEQMWQLLNIPMNIFEKNGEEESLLMHLKRFCTEGTWIDSSYLREMMQGLIGDITFQEAYNRTGRILNVNVSVAGDHDMPRLLNYLTAPNVVIWSAVVCSCSVPLIFQADSILAKNMKTKEIYSWTKRPFIDGSVDNDMPLGRLAEIFNVNHFVACQVNPHIAPLFNQDRSFRPATPPPAARSSSPLVTPSTSSSSSPSSSPASSSPSSSPLGWLTSGLSKSLQTGRYLFMNEVEHGLMMMKIAGIAPSVATTILNVIGQEYWGDITFVPPIHWTDVSSLFKNPGSDSIEGMIERGRKATWNKMALVRNHCAIELALDRAIVELRSKVISHVARPNSPTRHTPTTNPLRPANKHSVSSSMMATHTLTPQLASANLSHQALTMPSHGDYMSYSNPVSYSVATPRPASHTLTMPATPLAQFSMRDYQMHPRGMRGRSQSSSSLMNMGRRNSGEIGHRHSRSFRRRSVDSLHRHRPLVHHSYSLSDGTVKNNPNGSRSPKS